MDADPPSDDDDDFDDDANDDDDDAGDDEGYNDDPESDSEIDENDGQMDNVQIYRHRIDDGLDARFIVKAFCGTNHAPYVTFSQYNGLYCDYLPAQGHRLKFTVEEWKCLEHTIGLLKAFLNQLIHDNNFVIEMYHVVGTKYADAEMVEGEPTDVLYDTR